MSGRHPGAARLAADAGAIAPQTAAGAARTGRIASVDAIRLLAIVAVISLHTVPFGGPGRGSQPPFVPGEPGWFLNQLARFAVPFFFVVSGYFWSRKVQSGAAPYAAARALGQRSLLIFAAWSLIYLLPFDTASIPEKGWLGPLKAKYWDLVYMGSQPLRTLLQGTEMHLWFLVSLVCAVAIAAPFVRQRRIAALGSVAVGLYLVGLLAGAYALTPFGTGVEYRTRNGPFFGTVFFVTGCFLAQRTARPAWLGWGLLLALGGAALQMLETTLLWRMTGASPVLDYTVGTYFFGLGAALIALSGHRALAAGSLGALGKYTLGVYAVHMAYVDLLGLAARRFSSPLWQLGYIVLVALLSLATVLLMARSKRLRAIVM